MKGHHKIPRQDRCFCGERMIYIKSRWMCIEELKEQLYRHQRIINSLNKLREKLKKVPPIKPKWGRAKLKIDEEPKEDDEKWEPNWMVKYR